MNDNEEKIIITIAVIIVILAFSQLIDILCWLVQHLRITII